jgi:replicative DNA helicase
MMDGNGEQLGLAQTAERRLLAAMLADHEAIVGVSEILTDRSFTIPAMQDMYRAMLHCWERRVPGDFTNVDEQLKLDQAKHATLEDLVSLITPDDPTWSPAYAMHYARRVHHAERFRRIHGAYQDALVSMASNPDLDPAEVLMGVVGRITNGDVSDTGPLPTNVLMPALLDMIDEEMAGTRDTRGIPSGVDRLDDFMGGGFQPGELIILAARPGQGKTSLAMQMAVRASLLGTAMAFSLEMDADAIMRRMISTQSMVPFEAIRRGKLDADQYRRMKRATQELAALPIVIDDTAGLTADQIKVRIQRQQINGPVSFVMVDYLELVGDKNTNEEQRLSNIARSLKQTAKECGVVIVLLSQLSREVERRTPPIPQMKDLRWSGSLEAIADKILFIYREDYYIERGMMKLSDRQEPTANIAHIRLDKQRNGKVGIARQEWVGHCFAFRNPQYHGDEPDIEQQGF